MTSDPRTCLRELAALVSHAPPEKRASVARALDVVVSLLSAQTALPQAAKWFFENRTAPGEPDPSDDFWASRISAAAAAELQPWVDRVEVLFSEARHCDLVGNTGARWAYCALTILPELTDKRLPTRLLEELYEQVVSLDSAYELRPDRICWAASRRAASDAVLQLRYEHENPDLSQGHSMMRMQINDHEAVQYWPALDDGEYNFVDEEVLSEVCSLLGLRHVLPLQLATFLSVLANANSDGTPSWGGEQGAYSFHEGNLPYVLRHLTEPP